MLVYVVKKTQNFGAQEVGRILPETQSCCMPAAVKNQPSG